MFSEYKNYLYVNILITLIYLTISVVYLFYTYPAEDALILYRYSENLSNFFQIAFNQNDKPVEGATDFLWMIGLSLFSLFKIKPVFGSIILNTLSFFIIINFISSKLIKYNNLIIHIFFVLVFFNLGTVIGPSIVGFSTITFFALGTLVYLYAIEKKLFKWTIFSILFCLFRPESVIFFIFSIPLIYYNLSKKELKKFFILFSLIIFVGVLYNLFRIYYFQDILPITLQVKSIGGDFSLNRVFAVSSQISSTFFISMFVCVIICTYIIITKQKIYKIELFVFLLLNIALLIYLILLSRSYLSQNIYFRYFSHYHYVYLIFVIYLFNKINFLKTLPKSLLLVLLLISSVDQSNLIQRISKITDKHIYTPSYKIFDKINNPYISPVINISQTIKTYSQNFKIMITEAGNLPYNSKKYSIDIAGLNTYEFSQRPVNCKDFDIIKPDFIEFDVGPLEYFDFNQISNNNSYPACGVISKSSFYNDIKIFDYNNISLIDSYNYFKTDKHRNATVYVAANNALFCLRENKMYNQIFINKSGDQIYFINENNNIKEALLKSCNYKSNGYIFDNFLK